jgi:hypothetical protein
MFKILALGLAIAMFCCVQAGNAIELKLGDYLYNQSRSDSFRVAKIVACHRKDQAFTMGGGEGAGGMFYLTVSQWTIRIAVGDTILLEPQEGLRYYTLKSMKDCTGDFEVQEK